LWEVIGKSGSVCDASWPSFQPYNRILRKEYIFFRDFLKNIRLSSTKLKIANPKSANIFLSNVYEEKKVEVLKYLQSVSCPAGGFPASLMIDMKAFCEGHPKLQSDTKGMMQFGAFMRDEAAERGLDALATELTFNQKAILEVFRCYSSF
jgi:hypothetical protein